MFKRFLSVLFVILLCCISIPVGGGAIYRYMCFSRLSYDEIFDKSKDVYYYRLLTTRIAEIDDKKYIKCSSLKSVDDIFFGFRVAKEWSVYCAYIRDGTVYTAEQFNINSCAAVRNWEYIDEGYPKLVRDGGYSALK